VAITAPPATATVTLTIDGRELTVPEGTTIWDAARDAGIDIPVLCHDERYDPVGVCRMLEKTLRLTSICGLGQVALGPVVSVLGMERGATEARPHPRPGAGHGSA
jgi:predicted molibdopterin-dependent oxidoreductase YjgC